MEYPELEGTHKDHWSPTPGPAKTKQDQKSHPVPEPRYTSYL